MNAKKRMKMIKENLEEIMRQTIQDCKSSDPEVASKARQINSLAHDCSKDLDKLISDMKKPKKDRCESKLYKPVKKNSLY